MAIYDQILDEHRRRLTRLTDQRGVAKMRALYAKAEAEVLNRITRSAPRASAPFTAATNRMFLAQIRHGQGIMAQRLAGEMGDASKDIQTDALRGVIGDVKKLDRVFTGTTPVLRVEEAAQFAGVIDKRRTSLLRQHKTSMARYGSRLVGEMEGDLALSTATGESVDEAIGRVQKRASNEWWQAERIVRTESAWAYNVTSMDGTVAIAKDVPGVWLRWTEHVSDSGVPMDDRVGEDSIELHGQVTHPGGVFTMPPDPKVSTSMWNKTWSFPPNRPNDRAVVVPWKPEWGAPGWQWKGGRKVPVRV